VIDLPRVEGGYRVCAADPPWSFNDKGSRIAPDQATADGVRHYRTMSTVEIASLPVGAVMAPDSYLALWAPDTHVFNDAALVIRHWGFRFLHFIPWVKARWDEKEQRFVYQIGMGHTMRKAHEVCLLCARGRPTVADRGIPSAIIASKGKHSVKPEELQSKLERLSGGPYLELFARRPRPGWVCWGDQVNG
jgi:N6-adenosine-specific RNA methylase IME4